MNKEEQGALDAAMNFLANYAAGNVDGCEAAVASTPILVFGTNHDEVWKTAGDVRGAVVRDLSAMTNIRWGQPRHTHVVAVEALASVLIELPLAYQAGGKEEETLIRYALTLAPENGQWKIRSGMASIPFAVGTYSFSG